MKPEFEHYYASGMPYSRIEQEVMYRQSALAMELPLLKNMEETMKSPTKENLREIIQLAQAVMDRAGDSDNEEYKEASYFQQMASSQLAMAEANPTHAIMLSVGAGLHMSHQSILGRLSHCLEKLNDE